MRRSILPLQKSLLRQTSRISARRYTSSPNPGRIPPPQQPSSHLSRLPKSLQTYAHHFRSSPGSHITAFLVLHELTAILPFFVLTPAFYALNLSSYLEPYFPEKAKEYVDRKEERRKKAAEEKGLSEEEVEGMVWNTEWVLAGAVTYAVVKVFMPLRIAVSLWATPGFARAVVQPVGRWVRTFGGRRKTG